MSGARSNPVFRSTLVLTGRDGQVRNFASLEELPAELRREMDAALRSELAASILLADEAGQKYLSSRAHSAANAKAYAGWRSRALRRLALEAIGFAALALGLWMAVGSK
ncbi:MAG: hypothetical protein ACLQBJ_16040 [Bryobacteraceae bacterium]